MTFSTFQNHDSGPNPIHKEIKPSFYPCSIQSIHLNNYVSPESAIVRSFTNPNVFDELALVEKI